jgi:hypothetical protein
MLGWQELKTNPSKTGVQRALHCRCGREKILALGLEVKGVVRDIREGPLNANANAINCVCCRSGDMKGARPLLCASIGTVARAAPHIATVNSRVAYFLKIVISIGYSCVDEGRHCPANKSTGQTDTMRDLAPGVGDGPDRLTFSTAKSPVLSTEAAALAEKKYFLYAPVSC